MPHDQSRGCLGFRPPTALAGRVRQGLPESVGAPIFGRVGLPVPPAAILFSFTRLPQAVSSFTAGAVMKVRSSIKRICDKCKLIKRKGVVRIICEDPRHKQRQG